MNKDAFFKLLEEANRRYDAMTPEQQDAMRKAQRDSYVRSWPKSQFKWENGVKVYESYEDYCYD